MAQRGLIEALMSSLCLPAMAVGVLPSAAIAQPLTRSYDIPAQPLSTAIIAFSRQSGAVVTAPAILLEGKQARSIKGSFTPEDALRRLLAGTGLKHRVSSGGGFVLESDQAAAAIVPAGGPLEAEEEEFDGSVQGEVITVTGTRIRGGQPSAPVVTVSRNDMRRQGHSTMGEAIRALPQNFAGGQNPEVGIGAATGGGSDNQNLTGGSALNLRGLGIGATLTLLNGARLPYDGVSQATDVAFIPPAAIERIEVLLDGASAIYGSDAVAGVANIILRRDLDGAELSARFGLATDGGYKQRQLTLVAGKTWNGGGVLATGEISGNDPIRARHRDFLSNLPDQNAMIIPDSDQKGGIISAHHQIGTVRLALDAFYSKREQMFDWLSDTRIVDNRDNKSWGIAPSAGFELANRWSIKLSGFIGANDTISDMSRFDIASGALAIRERNCYCNDARGVTLEAEGPLFALPGGSARLAVGGGHRYNRLDVTDILGTSGLEVRGSRKSNFVFGELSLPVIGPHNELPFASRLALNGAVRYEDYSDVGDIATPKLGMIYSPVLGVDFKASWGRSFKAPTLFEQYFPPIAVLFPSFFYPGVPSGTILSFGGGSPALKPERAKFINAGVVLSPPSIPGLRVEAGYFNIDYRDRVDNPLATAGFAAFSSPIYADFAFLNPTLAQQENAFALAGLPFGELFFNLTGQPYDPSTVTGLLLGLNANVARQKAKGVDASVRYEFDLRGGTVNLNADATWLRGSRKLTASSPEQAATGFLYFPARFKGRAGASWTGDGILVAATLNHVAGVRNRTQPNNPRTDDFNTVDLVLGYTAAASAVGAFEITLAATNLFDSQPPLFVPISPLIPPYDPTNYSGIGRVVSLTLTKRF